MSAIAPVAAPESNIALNSADLAPPSRGVILHDSDGSDPPPATMSFGDFLDMINPLQHIPVISSIYRGITGDTINPVARVAGDALYSGAMGLASAGVSALAAVGDEVFAANNDGKTASATVVAALFGKDGDKASNKTTQIAVATPSAAASPLIAAPPLASAANTPIIQAPAIMPPRAMAAMPAIKPTITPATSPQVLAQTVASAYAAANNAHVPTAQAAHARSAAAAAAATSDPTLGLALNHPNLPYGGVMDTALMQNALQNQAVALAMANRRNNLAAAHAIRDSRFAVASPVNNGNAAVATNNSPSVAAAVASALPSTPIPGLTPSSATAPQTPANAAPTHYAVMGTDARALKGLDMYRHAAMAMPLAGSPASAAN